MLSQRRLWKWETVGLLLVACALLASPISDLIFSLRLALSLQKLASGAAGQNLDVRETKIKRKAGTQDYEALVYSPVKSQATTAVILVAGLSELGCYHPRLVAFSKLLADKGLLVITPDIREFREFKISAEPIRQIRFWYEQAPKLDGGRRVQKTGLAGISFSGTLALITAARPEIRDHVGFVACIGAYYDLIRCAKGWFAPGPVTVSENYYPTRFYAKWIIMLAALDMVGSEKDRLFLRNVLKDLLLGEKVRAANPDLTPEGARWYALAKMRENQSDPELSKKIEDYLVSRVYPQLDPKEALDHLRCPVFLMHGAYDNLIPPEESEDLHRHIPHSYLLISPFLTHTHPTDAPLTWGQKARAAVETIAFCYHFARTVRNRSW